MYMYMHMYMYVYMYMYMYSYRVYSERNIVHVYVHVTIGSEVSCGLPVNRVVHNMYIVHVHVYMLFESI